MEELKDIWKELKARLSSPLIGSYILAWPIFNWRIPLYIFCYKQNEIKLDGPISLAKAIEGQISWLYNLVLPLLVAITYTLVFPYLRGWIKVYQARILIKNQDKLAEIMSTAKSYAYKLEAEISKLESQKSENELIKKDLELKTHLLKEAEGREHAVQSELLSKQNSFTAYVEQKEKHELRNNAFFYEGKWKVEIKEDAAVVWEISGGYVSIKGVVTYNIVDVISDYNEKTIIIFSGYNDPHTSTKLIWILKTNGNDNAFFGRDNIGNSVRIERMPT